MTYNTQHSKLQYSKQRFLFVASTCKECQAEVHERGLGLLVLDLPGSGIANNVFDSIPSKELYPPKNTVMSEGILNLDPYWFQLQFTK